MAAPGLQQLTEFGLLGTLLFIALGFVTFLLRDLLKQRDRLSRIVDDNHDVVRDLSASVKELMSSEQAVQQTLSLVLNLLREIQHRPRDEG